MSNLIYTVMPKRRDGKIYSDMQKVIGDKFFHFEEEANKYLNSVDENIKYCFHVVPIVCMTPEEYDSMESMEYK